MRRVRAVAVRVERRRYGTGGDGRDREKEDVGRVEAGQCE